MIALLLQSCDSAMALGDRRIGSSTGHGQGTGAILTGTAIEQTLMALKKSELYSSLWASCDELRGGMDASQYKDYVLVLLFVKYVANSDEAARL
jgi:hypothetical protein